MKIKITIATLAGMILLLSFTINEFKLGYPNYFPEPAYDFSKNPLNSATIELGRYLFFDRRLSVNNTRSCATCHNPQFAFTDGYKRSLGVYADYGMTSMKKVTDQPLVTYSAPLTSAALANSVLATSNAGFVRSFATGIQFKLDFGKKKPKIIKPEMVDGDKDGITDSLDLCPCKAGCTASCAV